ncbi:MAG: response regulator, partial [Rhodothermales bacterium]|nr:response regulator [Rhodothermales bacterium]
FFTFSLRTFVHPPSHHRTTLRFPDLAQEAGFLADYARQSLATVRAAILLGTFVYGPLFGYLDWIQQSNAMWGIWGIRAGTCVLAAGVYLASYQPFFIRWMQEILSATIFLAGVGLMAMILLDTSPRAYIDGPVLLVLPGYVLMRIRLVYASAVGLSLLLVYVLIIYLKEDLPFDTRVGSVLFLFAANLIGMTAGYAMETYARRDFWQKRVIDAERRAKEELLDVRTRFFSNISHEIRTPLTLILGPLDDLMAGGGLPEPARVSLDLMRRNGRRLLGLINQLLDLSRLDAGRMPVRTREADLATFLHDLCLRFAPLAERKGIALSFESAEATLPAVFDAEKLEVIASNLLANALQYTPAGGVVRLSMTVDAEDRVRLVVRDSGAGIPAGELPHIFDRFHRVEQASAAHPGAGIGLSLTRALVERMGGTIEAESTVGFGSVFTVRIPRRVAGEPETRESDYFLHHDAEVEAAAEHNAPAGTLGVALVVEDNADIRAYIRRSLEADWAVSEAADGRAGLEAANRLVPDVIVTDLMMPGLDGMDLCRTIREDDALDHIPILALTARADVASERAGLEAGFDDYLVKPFDGATLAARVRAVVERYRRLQAIYSEHITVGPARTLVQSAERAFLERWQGLLEERMGEAHLSVGDLADAMGMSVRQLQRKITQLTGTSPNTALRDFRLEWARQRLTQGAGTVSEVAYAVGFTSASYFTKCYRERFGAAPTLEG